MENGRDEALASLSVGAVFIDAELDIDSTVKK